MRAITLKALAVLAMFFIAPVAFSAGPPPLPHYFYGTVKIDNVDAPAGTTIEAKVAGALNGTFNPIVTSEPGSYGSADPAAIVARLLVQGDIVDGAIIEFFVNNVKTNQTALWHSGQITRLNLAVGVVDMSPPSIALTPVAPDPTTSSMVTLTGVASDAHTGVALVEYRIDAGAWRAADPADGAFDGLIEGFTFTVNGLVPGIHTVLVRAIDAAGNVTPQVNQASDSFVVVEPVPPPSFGFGAEPQPAPPTTTVILNGLSGPGGSPGLAVDPAGVAQAAVQLEADDKGGRLKIDRDTRMKDRDGRALSRLTGTRITAPLAPPPGGTIAAAYDFGPNGATFDPPITLSMTFDTASLPAGVAADDLVIAFWNGVQWVNLETTPDTATNTLSAKIAHFTVFAIVVGAPPAKPEPSATPTPAPSPVPAPEPTPVPTGEPPTTATAPEPGPGPTATSVPHPAPTSTPMAPTAPVPVPSPAPSSPPPETTAAPTMAVPESTPNQPPPAATTPQIPSPAVQWGWIGPAIAAAAIAGGLAAFFFRKARAKQ